MADEQQRARPLDELRFEQLERLEIEIVGRLVEHQHVGRPREQPRQQQPVALAARQRLAPASARARAETGSRAGSRARGACWPFDGHGVVAVADRVDHRPLGIELLALLVVVGDLHVRAAPHLARVGLQLAEQQPQQRRLAGAVRPDQADAIAAHDARREVARRPRVRRTPCVTPLGFEHHLARRLGAARSAAAPCPAARAAPRAPRASPSARVTRPSSRVRRALMPWRSHTSSSASLLSNFSCCDRFVGEPLLLLAQERRVVAGPRRQPAAIELDDPRREPLRGTRGRG